MRHLRQDLRFAIRRFTSDKAFTLLAALALGLGVGVNTTFFSLVNAAVLRGLQIDGAEDVMFVSLRDASNAPRGLSFAEYDELRGSTRAFSEPVSTSRSEHPAGRARTSASRRPPTTPTSTSPSSGARADGSRRPCSPSGWATPSRSAARPRAASASIPTQPPT